MRALRPSPFDTLEVCFRLLTDGPAPLALDGRQIGHGAPARQIPLDELRALLHHPTTTDDLQRCAVQKLFRLATYHRGCWTIGLAGILLPGLRAIARTAPWDHHRLGNDAEADLLEQLRTAIRQPSFEAVEFAMAVLWIARLEMRRPCAPGPALSRSSAA